MSRWDNFQISPNGEQLPEGDENKAAENTSPHAEDDSGESEQKFRNINISDFGKPSPFSTINFIKAACVIGSIMLLIALCFPPKKHTGAGGSSAANLSEYTSSSTQSEKSLPNSQISSASSEKVALALALKQIGDGILQGKTYSEMNQSCQIAKLGEKQYNRFAGDYKTHGKDYFIEQFKTYVQSQITELQPSAESGESSDNAIDSILNK